MSLGFPERLVVLCNYFIFQIKHRFLADSIILLLSEKV